MVPQLNLKQLLHLRVETKNGDHLGEVHSLNIDPTSHLVVSYVVKSSLLPKPIAHELIVSSAQVVSIDEKKMIVEDAVVTELGTLPRLAV